MPKLVVVLIDQETTMRLDDTDWTTITADAILHEGGAMTPHQEVRVELSKLEKAIERARMLISEEDGVTDGTIN